MTRVADAAHRSAAVRRRSPFEIFLAVMTGFSLVTAGVLFVDWATPFEDHLPVQIVIMLEWVDLFFVVLFLADWFRSLATAKDRARYLFGERPGRSVPYGVLELFGCVPYSFFFRVLRIARLRRIGWAWSDLTPRSLYRAVLASRAESAALVTFLVAFLVVVLGAIAVLYFEHDEPITTIADAEDAIWWAFATMTTVGYGDVVPFTFEGRFVGVLTMLVGIGIFAALAGALAGVLAAGRDYRTTARARQDAAEVSAELTALRAEIRELRQALETKR